MLISWLKNKVSGEAFASVENVPSKMLIGSKFWAMILKSLLMLLGIVELQV